MLPMTSVQKTYNLNFVLYWLSVVPSKPGTVAQILDIALQWHCSIFPAFSDVIISLLTLGQMNFDLLCYSWRILLTASLGHISRFWLLSLEQHFPKCLGTFALET